MQKRSFSRSALGAIFLAVAVGGVTAQASPAIEPFAVGANIPYASGSEAMQQVVNAQCHWTASAIAKLVKNTKGAAKVSDQDLTTVQGRKLEMTVRNSVEPGVATEASPRWIAISGRMFDKGVEIGDFTLTKKTTDESLSDCKAITDMGESLAGDIADWVQRPSPAIRTAVAVTAENAETVDEDTRQTCPWDKMVPNSLVTNSSGHVVLSTEDLTSYLGPKLVMQVTALHTAGGGRFSGPKWLALNGTLLDHGKTVGSFSVNRHTMSGSWKGCTVLGNISDEVGDDILKWLEAPTMDAKLGDAK